jgi:hypothetical protein
MSARTTARLSNANMDLSIPPYSTSNIATYRYQPLAAESDEIRLVHVFNPSERRHISAVSEELNAIVLSIQHMAIDRAAVETLQVEITDYVALSYVWGSKYAQPRRIYVQHYDDNLESTTHSYIEVRENLFHFLRHFQSREENVPDTNLWIDQLCIHQEDVKERNHQVKLMANIYHNARYGITWLECSTATVHAARLVASRRKEIRTG